MIWNDLNTVKPDRCMDCGVLFWREQPEWAKGWNMRGWAYFYPNYATFITHKKQFSRSLCQTIVDSIRKITHWIYLPYPDNAWAEICADLPPTEKKGGYILLNPYSKKITIATASTAQNIIKASTKTGSNRIKYWQKLVGPYDKT